MSTIVNQGTTIDNLPSLDSSLTPEQKQAFIDGAFVPIRGEVNGTKTTFKVTGNDLAASGENKIDSISVNGSPVAPDANKNVALTIPAEQVNADWTENDDSEPSFIANKPFDEVDGSGGLDIIKGSLVVQIDKETIRRHDGGTLYVANPVPELAANHADAGKVLTVKTVDNVDEIVWATPAGGVPSPSGVTNGYVLTANNGAAGWAAPAGGGGGNPYTKTTVTPGSSYRNGETSPYGYVMYDQDVSIANNTYSVLSSTIGWDTTRPEEDEEGNYEIPSKTLDNLVIKLPANTDFPMALVEFDVYLYQDEWTNDEGCVNNVKVFVGETELKRMYNAPHHPNMLLLSGSNNDQFQFWKPVETITQQYGDPYYMIKQINYWNNGSKLQSFVGGSRVQVNIFGNCFTVTTSMETGEAAAS